MSDKTYDVLVLGGGPGGYAAAIRLSQLGLRAAIVERDRLGGVCLNVGCIPSKALIAASRLAERIRRAGDIGLHAGPLRVEMERMQSWKDGIVSKLTSGVAQLCKGNHVEVIAGAAAFRSDREVLVNGSTLLEAKHFVVATGSRPAELKGFEFGGRVLGSTEALALTEVPARLAVLGGGYIGLELGTMYARLGSQVTVVEMMEQLLPGFDPDIVRVLAQKLRRAGVIVHTGARAVGVEQDAAGIRLAIEHGGQTHSVEADYLLVTVGRRPNSDGLNLESAGVRVNPQGFVGVDRELRTSAAPIFAIGDVAGNPMLAHKARKEGEIVAEVIAGRSSRPDYLAMPAVVFADPEVASVGLSEALAVAQGRKVKIGKVPFAANGRALSIGEAEGFVKLVSDTESGALLGMQIVGPEASELIAEGALAIEMGASVEDLALTVHAHPTLAEAVMETAQAVLGSAVHVLNR